MAPEPMRPAYSTSKRALWISGALAWLVIVSLVGGALAGERVAVDMAGIVVPSMVFLIVAMLGLHRAFGSLDMRTLHGGRPPVPRQRRSPRETFEGEPA